MSPTKAQILVTGGGGYVGSHCVLELLNAGYDVVAVDNFVNAVKDPSGQSEYPESLVRVQQLTGEWCCFEKYLFGIKIFAGKKCAFHTVDLLDKAALSAVFSQHPAVQVIINIYIISNVTWFHHLKLMLPPCRPSSTSRR